MDHLDGEGGAVAFGCGCGGVEAANVERATLWTLLLINGAMFVVEAATGWWSESTGLLADSLDMLADASVYGIALYAVGRSSRSKSVSAFASGILQITLGAGVMAEVGRRFLHGSKPISAVMIVMGCLALIANVSCMLLLARHRKGGVHMRSSWIFSTNDVIANIGVIVSGAAVMFFGSRLPDLIVGAVISLIVMYGGLRILKDVRTSAAASGERT